MRSTLPHDHILNLMRQTRPLMRYRGDQSFVQWQKAGRAQLKALLRLPENTCDPAFLVESVKDYPGYTDTRFSFQTEPGLFIPCHLLLPKGQSSQFPLAVCLQGHSRGMHISLGEVRYPGDEEGAKVECFGLQALAEGYAALVVENRDMGECGGDADGPHCHETAMANLLMGRTTLGCRLWDDMRAMDMVAAHFPEVDVSHAMVMGHSGGGMGALFLAALEPRIEACLVSSYVCSYEYSIANIYHCACNHVPELRQYFDCGDICGLVAPKPMVIITGDRDPIFPYDGVRKAVADAEVYYGYAGASKRLRFVTGEGKHQFFPELAWPALKAVYSHGG